MHDHRRQVNHEAEVQHHLETLTSVLQGDEEFQEADSQGDGHLTRIERGGKRLLEILT